MAVNAQLSAAEKALQALREPESPVGEANPSTAQSSMLLPQSEKWVDGQWFEATLALRPMVSLVYPSVYPVKVDGGESKDWCGSGRVFRFRPRRTTALAAPTFSFTSNTNGVVTSKVIGVRSVLTL